MRRRHQDDVRAKIGASQIVNRLQNHIDGKVELSATQIAAAKILLGKSLPDLSSIEHGGAIGLEHSFASILERIGSGSR